MILSDARSCALDRTLKAGVFADELAAARSQAHRPVNTIRAHRPEVADLEGPTGQVHVIGVQHGKIITERSVQDSAAAGVAKLSVLERYGRGSRPANAYVMGFGEKFRGAIASSVGHDSHNLISVGSNAFDMRTAMGALIDSGGGFCVVQDGAVRAHLSLPFGGLMSESDPSALKDALLELKEASRSIGCELPEPFLQLAFLSLPVIPSLKLTDRGLVDVDQFKIIDVRAS